MSSILPYIQILWNWKCFDQNSQPSHSVHQRINGVGENAIALSVNVAKTITLRKIKTPNRAHLVNSENKMYIVAGAYNVYIVFASLFFLFLLRSFSICRPIQQMCLSVSV